MNRRRTRYRIAALHGFFGKPSDWEPISGLLPEARWSLIDLWAVLQDPAVRDWISLGSTLGGRLRAVAHEVPELPTFVVAYSFGARLALSLPRPGTVSLPLAGICLISCHPGLAAEDASVRAARRVSDAAWERKILEAPEEDVLRQWDSQAVLAASGVARPELRFPAARATLASAMRRFSLAGQPDFRPQLRQWPAPLLWVAGDGDEKFASVAQASRAGGLPGEVFICGGAGHRVPWDAPVAFSGALASWIDRHIPRSVA